MPTSKAPRKSHRLVTSNTTPPRDLRIVRPRLCGSYEVPAIFRMSRASYLLRFRAFHLTFHQRCSKTFCTKPPPGSLLKSVRIHSCTIPVPRRDLALFESIANNNHNSNNHSNHHRVLIFQRNSTTRHEPTILHERFERRVLHQIESCSDFEQLFRLGLHSVRVSVSTRTKNFHHITANDRPQCSNTTTTIALICIRSHLPQLHLHYSTTTTTTTTTDIDNDDNRQ